jgi:hypothetical protein
MLATSNGHGPRNSKVTGEEDIAGWSKKVVGTWRRRADDRRKSGAILSNFRDKIYDLRFSLTSRLFLHPERLEL